MLEKVLFFFQCTSKSMVFLCTPVALNNNDLKMALGYPVSFVPGCLYVYVSTYAAGLNANCCLD